MEEAPLTDKPVEPTSESANSGSIKSPTRRSAPEAQRQNSVKPLADDKVSLNPLEAMLGTFLSTKFVSHKKILS